MKKATQKLLCFIMALMTLAALCAAGLTPSAENPGSVTVNVVVPELIYLTPGSNAFRDYIAGAENGTTPAADKASTGAISFECSAQASSISVSCSGASAVSLSTTSVSGTDTLTATINGGSMASWDADGLLTWTFTYVIRGVTYYTYAYTYVYSPFLGQVGCTANFDQTSGTQNAQFNGYFFIVGVHSASGGNFYSAFVEPNGNNYFPSQPGGNWTDGSYGTRKSPLVPGWAGRRHNLVDQGANNEWQGDVPGWYDASAKYLDDHFPPNANGQGGVAENRLQTGNGGTYTFGSYDTTGYINVDSSRYLPGSTDLNKVPNLAGGWMVSHVFRAGDRNWVNWFGSAGSNNEPDNILNFKPDGDIKYSNGYYRGQSYGLHATKAGQKVPQYSTKYNIITRVHQRDSIINTMVDMRTRFGLQITLVNKSVLRANVNDCITQNYQEIYYTPDIWAAYIDALETAGSVLGNPTVTQAEVDEANAALTNAVPPEPQNESPPTSSTYVSPSQLTQWLKNLIESILRAIISLFTFGLL